MDVERCDMEGLLVIRPAFFGDARGFFMETWQQRRYADAGLPETFVQDNVSFSRLDTLRGIHLQSPHPQGKLVSVLQGEVYDVAVDLRRGSPTFARWHGVSLSSDNHTQFYVPPGFGHAFVVRSETALFAYKCTELYHPVDELTIVWDDPDIGIRWPVEAPILSEKDRRGLRLRDVPPERWLPG